MKLLKSPLLGIKTFHFYVEWKGKVQKVLQQKETFKTLKDVKNQFIQKIMGKIKFTELSH